MPGINLQYGNIPAVTRTAITTTASGNAQISTAQFLYGNASGLFQSAGSAELTCTNTGPLTFGTNDFTIELSFRVISYATNVPVLLCNSRSIGFTTNAWVLQHNDPSLGPNKLIWSARNFSGVAYMLTSSSNISVDTWYQAAITRSGNTFRMFINGNLEATNTFAGSVDGGVNHNITFGRESTSGTLYNGYIDEARFSNIARYTANYTATGPFTNDANTTLLLHMDGANASTSFPDDNIGVAPQGGITIQYADISQATRTAISTTVGGNAEISTSEFVFGNASLRTFANASQVTMTNAGGILSIGTNNFTIELRVRPVTKATSFPHIIANFVSGFTSNQWVLCDRHNAFPNNFSFWVGNANAGAPILVSTTTVANDTWYAISITRSGNTWRMFINGTLEATTTNSASLDGNSSSDWYFSPNNSAIWYNGYVDEVRVSNIARYTANYTPATSAFTNDANTTMLLHCDGTNGSKSLPDDNISILPTAGITITY